MYYWLVSCAIFSVFGTFIMFAASTGPEEAISNLSKWAASVGLRPPRWLEAKKTDYWAKRIGGLILLLSLGGAFVSIFAYHPSSISPYRWEPLSAVEQAKARSLLRLKPKSPATAIICGTENCRELADSIEDLFSGLGWENLRRSYVSQGGTGIRILQPETSPISANEIANAFDEATQGRITAEIDPVQGLDALWILIGEKPRRRR
jgi:hypothetical protein